MPFGDTNAFLNDAFTIFLSLLLPELIFSFLLVSFGSPDLEPQTYSLYV